MCFTKCSSLSNANTKFSNVIHVVASANYSVCSPIDSKSTLLIRDMIKQSVFYSVQFHFQFISFHFIFKWIAAKNEPYQLMITKLFETEKYAVADAAVFQFNGNDFSFLHQMKPNNNKKKFHLVSNSFLPIQFCRRQ